MATSTAGLYNAIQTANGGQVSWSITGAGGEQLPATVILATGQTSQYLFCKDLVFDPVPPDAAVITDVRIDLTIGEDTVDAYGTLICHCSFHYNAYDYWSDTEGSRDWSYGAQSLYYADNFDWGFEAANGVPLTGAIVKELMKVAFQACYVAETGCSFHINGGTVTLTYADPTPPAEPVEEHGPDAALAALTTRSSASARAVAAVRAAAAAREARE